MKALWFCYRCKRKQKKTGRPKKVKCLEPFNSNGKLLKCVHCGRIYSVKTLRHLRSKGFHVSLYSK